MSKRSDNGFTYSEQSGSNVANDYYLREIGEKDKYEKDKYEKYKYEKDMYCCKCSYKGAMLRFMVLMNIIAKLSKAIQLGGVQDVEVDVERRGLVALNFGIEEWFIGNMLFFIVLGFGWYYMSRYIKNYEILRSDLSETLGIITVVVCCFIQYIMVRVTIWPFCTFVVFLNLIFKAHDNATDDEEKEKNDN